MLNFYFLYRYFISFLEVFFAFMFFSEVLGRREYRSVWIYIAPVFAISISMFVWSVSNEMPTLKTLTYVIVIMGYACIFDDKLLNRLFYAVIFLTAQIATEAIVLYIANSFFMQAQPLAGAEYYRRVIISVIIKIFLFCSLQLIGNSGSKNRNRVPLRYSGLLVIIFFIIMISLFLTFNLSATDVVLLHIISLLLIGTIVYIMFYSLNKYFNELERRKLHETTEKLSKKYYSAQESSYHQIRKMWHDMKNHISCINGLAQNEDYARLTDYLSELSSNIENMPISILTGNEIADVVLNMKKVEAVNYGISFAVKATVPPNMTIPATDLSAVLFNAIDNAIEACRKIENKEHRIISVNIQPDKDYLYIRVVNNISDEKAKEKSDLRTDKSDKLNHGFGIEIIRGIAKQYGGWFDYAVADKEFSVTVILKFD